MCYAFYLLIVAIRIMSSTAKKTGNQEGYRDVRKIIGITVILIFETVIYSISVVTLAILRYNAAYPF